MNRIDFHSVVSLLQNHLIESADMTQIVFISTLFSCFVNDSDFSFDEGLCCKWMKGQAKISPKIVSYYQLQSNKAEMYADMEEELFLQISDIGAMAEDLQHLLLTDTSMSELQRTKLLQFYDNSDAAKIAQFTSEVLVFAMSRPFLKASLKPADTSPSIEDVILTTTVPKPVKSYIDDNGSIDELHLLLSENNTLFIQGIPGVGKSELIKAYCKAHKKDYTNILFLPYTGSLYEMIADLDFVDDTDPITEKERFRKHFRFLKTLKKDSLIVIDNFDTTEDRDNLLSQICDLKCSTVFTTHGNFRNYPQYEVTVSPELATGIFQTHCQDVSLYTQEEMSALLETVHYHSMSVELIARLLAYAGITANELLHKLQENALLQQDNSKLSLTKDNRTHRSHYSKHMDSLIHFHTLEPTVQSALSVLALAPETGFPLSLFYQWYGSATNEITELEELGLLNIQQKRLILNPYMRRLINAGQHLTANRIESFLQKLNSCLADETCEHHQFILDIINTALRFIHKEKSIIWKRSVAHALQISAKLHRYRLFQKLLSEYEGICYLYDYITNDDRALLFHYQATERAFIYQNYNQAVRLEEQAIAEACNTGTFQIFTLSSFYLDTANYYSKLQKPEKSLDYIQKSLDLLTNTQMLFSPGGLYTTMTYAKFLYHYGDFRKSSVAYQNCLGVLNQLYKTDTLTKGYLLQNLAVVQASLGNKRASALYLSQAENIFRKYLQEEHPDLLLCQKQLQDILSKSDTMLTLLTEDDVA